MATIRLSVGQSLQNVLRGSTPALVKKQSTLSMISWRGFASTVTRNVDFTHAVIGGGAVGLAIARKLAERDGTSTILIERHGAVGTETSSRNSEVIHAGLYYGPDSLKTRLCIQGKEMMYALCGKYGIPHKRIGKWIVAQSEEQMEELHQVHDLAQRIHVPTRFIPLDRGKELEPAIHAEAGILESPSTGILDSHSYMQYLLGAFLSSGGDVAYHTTVTSLAALPRRDGYQITATDQHSHESTTISASTLINAAGLGACAINNLLLPAPHHVQPIFAKGNYFAYAPQPALRIQRLIYPVPAPGLGGLGTHLTLDLAGQMRFGPDVEYVTDPTDLDASAARLPAALAEIRRYLPSIDARYLRPDYAGIRPKLAVSSSATDAATAPVVGAHGMRDFIIRDEAGRGFPGFVNLLGIESPGLTASLAIAVFVEEILYG